MLHRSVSLPDELKRIANRESELVNLKTATVIIPANVSKTRRERQVTISDNIAAWLDATKGKPIIPANFDRLVKLARKHFGWPAEVWLNLQAHHDQQVIKESMKASLSAIHPCSAM